jgi:hypothetical protein
MSGGQYIPQEQACTEMRNRLLHGEWACTEKNGLARRRMGLHGEEWACTGMGCMRRLQGGSITLTV